jgi:hypothetical protein
MQLQNQYYYFKSAISEEICQKIIETGDAKMAAEAAKGHNITGNTNGDAQRDAKPNAAPQGDFTKEQLIEQGLVDADTYEAEALQNILSDYCTLRPDRTEYPLRCDYDPYELKWPIDIVAVSCISYMVPALSALFYGQLIMSAQLLAFTYFTWLHHLSREKYYARLSSTLATLTAAYTVYTYPLTPLAILPTLAAAYYYSIGNPRDSEKKRGPYVHTQSLFNLFASIAIWTLVA